MLQTALQANLFLYTRGNREADVLIIGDCFTSYDKVHQVPFGGFVGKEFDRMLFDAGLPNSKILFASVTPRHAKEGYKDFVVPKSPAVYPYKGLRADDTLRSDISKLHDLIKALKPKLIITAGDLALHAVSNLTKVKTDKGSQKITGSHTHRGSQTYTESIHGTIYPLLPIVSIESILINYSLRHITVHDLKARAARFISGKRAWEAPQYNFNYSGKYDDAVSHLQVLIHNANMRAERGERYSICCDVETWKQRYLAVVGLADAECSIAIPFFYFDAQQNMVNTFSLDEEVEIIRLLRILLTHPAIDIVNQNFQYDFQYIYRYLWIKVYPTFDTMLAHHLMFPGTKKSLEYLASLYCDHYTYWKDESQDWDAQGSHTDMWHYNCKDTRYTYDIVYTVKPLLERMNLLELFQSQLAQLHLALDLWIRGVNWDHATASQYRMKLLDEATKIQDYLLECMPEDIRYTNTGKPWFTSTKHCQYIFYDLLGIQKILHKKTKNPTLNAESFETLKKRAPWLGPVFNRIKLLRSIEVFQKNFLNARAAHDKRMHTSFNIGGTETFRWSSSSDGFNEGLNLQNIPKEKED